jgi:hypothetical protein
MSEITPRRMVRLQAKLNSIFVRKRDAGEPIAGIYAQLSIVEHWLNRHHVFW